MAYWHGGEQLQLRNGMKWRASASRVATSTRQPTASTMYYLFILLPLYLSGK
jgi:hypothetical protein